MKNRGFHAFSRWVKTPAKRQVETMIGSLLGSLGFGDWLELIAVEIELDRAENRLLTTTRQGSSGPDRVKIIAISIGRQA